METTSRRANSWLCDFRKTRTSQHGEDGVIEKIFETIGTKESWCVEFGAGSGKKGNNTWSLILEKHWKAVLIEAERALYADLSARYKDRPDVVCVNALVEESGAHALENILAQTDIPKQFDFLSIDIDGHDYHVWKSLEIYRPRVVMIEINPNMPIDLHFVQPKDIRAAGGSSLLAMSALAKEKGYELIYAHGTNAAYVQKELFPLFEINTSVPSEIICEEEREHKSATPTFFQMYDGSIVLLGVERKKVLAYRKKIRDVPVWVFEHEKLFPIRFKQDNKITRVLKNSIKKTRIYSFFYPLVKKIYGKVDDRAKENINVDS